jgi:hypothetical protein
MPDPAKRMKFVPYYLKEGYIILCTKKDCLHYGNNPNCLEKPMDRQGNCYAPKDLPTLLD